MGEPDNCNATYIGARTKFGKSATINEDLFIGGGDGGGDAGDLVRDEELEQLKVRGPSMLHYLRVEDCPVLESLDIDEGDPEDPDNFNYPQTVLWLKLDSLPAMKCARIYSGIRSLEIRNLPALEELDLSGCSQLTLLLLESTPALRKLDITGCTKLGEISGLDEARQAALGIPEQIAKNQAPSRLDGLIYENMTASDIAIALQALKTEAAAINEDSDQYDFFLLDPLGTCYTGGSGETYSYDLFGDSLGQHTPEDCLTALRERLDTARDREE